MSGLRVFDRVKGLFHRPPQPVLLGHAVSVENAELNIEFFGSIHEVKRQAAASTVTLAQVLDHPQTRLTVREVLQDAPVLEWSGGAHAMDFIELMEAVSQDDVAEVGRFADALKSDAEGAPLPLIAAAAKGHAALVDALVKAGAPINGGGQFGMTALHWACGRGHSAVASALLLAGGALHQPNWFAFTPLELASMNGHERLAKKLDARAALPSATSWHSLTAKRLRSD